MNATTRLSDDDRRRVELAIAEAESKTSAEIVCALATESGRYDRAESIVGLFCALAALSLAHAIPIVAAERAGGWAVGGLHLGWQSLAVVAGFLVGSVLAGCVHGLRRLLVREGEMECEAQRAASHVFALATVGATAQRTGLLVYVSLFERRVVILADEAARRALGDETIAGLRDLAVSCLKAGRFADAFVETVERAAPRLAEHLPASRTVEENELSDRLRVFHPRAALA